jgi:hypothetical protein
MGDKQEYKGVMRLEVIVSRWKTGDDKCGIEECRIGPLHGANTTLWVENESIYNPHTPTGEQGGE